ncbi:hypothetical protein NFC81_09100 [Salinispirillum sp. LH 10-3-1]|uniref:50S ribosomal protein L7/L12 n=1 Tax=Salinispirillum sp. LH 10-3-1 TaxID=2952525 RepID=A0AB38YC25_9GAMM
MAKLTKAKLEAMSATEIADILKNEHGIEVDVDDENKGALVEQVLAAQTAKPNDTGKVTTKSSGGKAATKSKKTKILIGEQEGEADYVFVGVNGRQYQIPRGKEVEVPAEVVQVLRDAVTEKFETKTDPKTGQKYSKPKMVPRFNFQVITE